MPLSSDIYKRIYTLGPKGTFSNAAASLVGREKITEIEYCTTLPQITKWVVQDETSLGVIPIENSTSGTVTQAQDSLIDHDVEIIGEISVAVEYALVSYVGLSEIERYYCHTVAFNQCMLYEAEVIPQAEVVFSNSNIHSAQMFVEAKGQNVAAIVPQPFAKRDQNLTPWIKGENIQDLGDNETRFLVICKKKSTHFDFSRSKTSLYIELHEDRHSLLLEVLQGFHKANINLCRLESRPAKGSKWQYGFFIDFYNNDQVANCLAEFSQQKIDYRILGTFGDFKP